MAAPIPTAAIPTAAIPTAAIPTAAVATAPIPTTAVAAAPIPTAARTHGGVGDSPLATLADKPLRIGEVAELTGTTPRTIRYYEEIGLLPGAVDRAQGKHRCYAPADVDRVREIVRLRDLLGLSLEQLSTLLEAEAARAELRREWQQAEAPDIRRRILTESLGHIATQLELVRGRLGELGQLEGELVEKRRSVRERIDQLEA